MTTTIELSVCANGLHPMTGDNVRVRTGDRAGFRECKACQRDGWAKRYREDRDGINRARGALSKARGMGLTLRQRAGVFTISDAGGKPVHSGDIESVERWLSDHFVRTPSGPKPLPVPPAWVKWIDVFVDEQNAAKLSAGTIVTRTKHLVIFARRNPSCDPLTVSRDDLVRYLGDSGWRPTTTHAVKSTFQVFYRTLFDLGHRLDDPDGAHRKSSGVLVEIPHL